MVKGKDIKFINKIIVFIPRIQLNFFIKKVLKCAPIPRQNLENFTNCGQILKNCIFNATPRKSYFIYVGIFLVFVCKLFVRFKGI